MKKKKKTLQPRLQSALHFPLKVEKIRGSWPHLSPPKITGAHGSRCIQDRGNSERARQTFPLVHLHEAAWTPMVLCAVRRASRCYTPGSNTCALARASPVTLSSLGFPGCSVSLCWYYISTCAMAFFLSRTAASWMIWRLFGWIFWRERARAFFFFVLPLEMGYWVMAEVENEEIGFAYKGVWWMKGVCCMAHFLMAWIFLIWEVCLEHE